MNANMKQDPELQQQDPLRKTAPEMSSQDQQHPFRGLNNIILGDVCQALPKIPRESVHLVVTSPPYNLDMGYEQHDDDLEDRHYLEWMRSVWEETIKVLVPGGRICINIGENKRQNITNPTFSAFIQQLVEMRMLYRGTIIWNKNSAFKHCAWGSWQSPSNPHVVPRHEYIIVFSKGQWKLEGPKEGIDISDEEFMTCTRSIWMLGTEHRKRVGHPAPFPEALPDRLIKFLSFRGQTVMDPFAGSGTVGLVAARLGRPFILIDNSPQYCKLALERINQEQGLFLKPAIVPVDEL